MDEWVWQIYQVAEWVIPLGLLPVLATRHGPRTAYGWIFLSLLLPVTALVLYLYLGAYRQRKRRKRSAGAREDVAPILEAALRAEPARFDDPLARGLAGLVERSQQERGWCAVGGNAVEVVDDTERATQRLIEDIGAARHSVHLLYYLFDGGDTATEVGEALLKARERGVRCRLLVDSFSSRFEGTVSLFKELAPRLVEGGVEVECTAPLSPLRSGVERIDLRDHRKIAVIDGCVAWTGSLNVHDHDMGLEDGGWHQLVVRIEGPVARQLQAVFAEDWGRLTGGPVPLEEAFPDGADQTPSARGEAAVQTVAWTPADPTPSSVHVLTALMNTACERLTLATAYFYPDESLLVALRAAAYRGVVVDLVLPGCSDKPYVDAAARSRFATLLEAGVRIHLHRSGMLHVKAICIDDAIAYVGSSNLDRRSLYLDYEAGVILYDDAATRRVRRALDGWIDQAERVDAEAFRKRPLWRRSLDGIAGLLGPLL